MRNASEKIQPSCGVGLLSEPVSLIEPALKPSLGEPLKLHLGCGNQRIAGYVNCDLHPTTATERVFDCTTPWPFADDCASTIYSSHHLEHLIDFKTFFREAHRVLRPDGNLQIRVPYGGHRAAYWDIEHVRPWYAETFCFLQPGYYQAIGNAQHAGWSHFFSIEDVVLRITDKLTPLLRHRLLRRLLLPWLEHFHDTIEEMWVYLIPLKTSAQVADWSQSHPGHCVPARYSIYRHHLERRPLGAQELAEFVDWRRDQLWNGFHHWWKK